MSKYWLIAVPLTSVVISGCQSAGAHLDDVRAADSEKTLSVGKVQREIKVGMTGGQVAEVLGSPNIVSTDENRQEVWIYDKISTEQAYSQSEGGATLILIGGGNKAGARSTNQRTLTIIIKFDKGGKVRDFAYHRSSF
jgi:outer membrane protein assembly factor BamE (lipoprotein component of BamABCDE complex)